MLQPKQSKYRKQHKGRIKGSATSGNTISFGKYAIKSLVSARISARQIESARRAISRSLQRNVKIWVRIFPDKPITKKPVEVRQGKGKGNVEYWVAVVKVGKVLFEIADVDIDKARRAFYLASSKLPVKTKFFLRG
jgi:large subunit ribosomal protein L16